MLAEVPNLDKLCEILKLKRRQCEVLVQAFPKFCVCGKGKKRKRAPSPYNKYIGKCVPEKRGEAKTMPVTEAFKACAADYKVAKQKGLVASYLAS